MAPQRPDDAELDLTVRDALDHRVGVPDGERDPQVGVLALELAEEERHEVRARAGGRARARASP